MKRVTTFIHRHSVLTYFLLTLAISWGGILVATTPGGLPITPEQFEMVGPFVYLAMLVGPSVAGILLIGLIDGRSGLRSLLSRLLRWRVGARWYAIAILTAPVLCVVVFLALSRFSPEFLPSIFTTNDAATLLLTSVVAGIMVGFFEEIGWTGFAVPRLLRRLGILSTGLLVGVLWGGWHFLVFWESDTFSGVLPLALLLVRLFAWLPAYRVLMVWVYEHTESLPVVMFMHASLVASQFIFFPATLTGATALIAILAWAAVLWIAVAVVAAASRGHPVQQRLARAA